MNIQRYRIVSCDDGRHIIKEPCDVGPYVLYEDHKYALKQLQKDAAIGRLIRRRLVSGNDIPVSRAYVRAQEVNDIDAGEER